MGADKTTQKTSTEATPEERQLNQLQLEQAKAFDPIQRQLNTNGGNLINQLLTGQALPGYLQGALGVSDEQTQSMVDASLRDLYPQFQSSGILDSGVAASIAGRTAGDIRNQNAQFNVQALQQILNQAVGGQASVQQSSLNTTNQLGNRLSGLRSTSQTLYQMNPFLKSFQQSAGSSFGSSIGQGAGTATKGFLL